MKSHSGVLGFVSRASAAPVSSGGASPSGCLADVCMVSLPDLVIDDEREFLPGARAENAAGHVEIPGGGRRLSGARDARLDDHLFKLREAAGGTPPHGPMQWKAHGPGVPRQPYHREGRAGR